MRKSYKKRPKKPLIPYFRVNQKIRAPKVRLIDENNEMVGVVSLDQALEKAQQAELDLVEVSPKTNPPVCKILDFGSFKYQKEKDARSQKIKQKVVEIKGVRLSLRIGKHDRDIRLKQTKKFLQNNDKVKIELNLRGRERQHADQAKKIIDEFIQELDEEIKIEQPFAKQGGKLSIVIAPKT